MPAASPTGHAGATGHANGPEPKPEAVAGDGDPGGDPGGGDPAGDGDRGKRLPRGDLALYIAVTLLVPLILIAAVFVIGVLAVTRCARCAALRGWSVMAGGSARVG